MRGKGREMVITRSWRVVIGSVCSFGSDLKMSC